MDRHPRGSPPPPPPRGGPPVMRDGFPGPRGGDGGRPGPPYGYRDAPPPPPPRGGGPPEYNRGGPHRRPRSASPPFDRYGGGRRGSPPPFKRGRRDDAMYDKHMRDPSPGYRGRSPPRGGYSDRGYYGDDRGRGPPGGRDRGGPDDKARMLSFKEFLLELPGDPTPEEAQARYREYLVEYYGSEIKAEFAQKKNDEGMRAAFDPRMHEKQLAKRNEEAVASLEAFQADLDADKLDPAAPSFNQGALDMAPPKPEGASAMDTDGKKEEGKGPAPADDAPKVDYAPVICWRPERVEVDLPLSRRLIRRLDWEKGTRCPLLPEMPLPPATTPGGGEGGKKDSDAPEREFVEEEVEPVAVSSDNVAECLGRLDQQLAYLWRVHGVDYYAGYELEPPAFHERNLFCRMLRAPLPENPEEQPDEAAVKELTEAVERTVNEFCNKRIAEGDPSENRCQRKRIEEVIEKWIDSQIVQHGDQKWGNKLSSKMFVGRKFVVKHIRVKHEDKIQAERDRVYDDIYFENFKAFKESERADIERQQGEGEQQGPEQGEGEGFVEGFGPEGGAPMRGRGGRGLRGRGRGMMMGRGRGMPFMMEGMMPIMPMPMPMGPIGAMAPVIMPGPMGPFLPMGPGPILAGPGPMMGMGGRRGGRGGPMGMGMRGGRGGRFGGAGMMAAPGAKLDPNGIREYYDLDNPQNNRAVLDYGDL